MMTTRAEFAECEGARLEGTRVKHVRSGYGVVCYIGYGAQSAGPPRRKRVQMDETVPLSFRLN